MAVIYYAELLGYFLRTYKLKKFTNSLCYSMFQCVTRCGLDPMAARSLNSISRLKKNLYQQYVNKNRNVGENYNPILCHIMSQVSVNICYK